MNKKTYRLMSVIVALALTFGGYYSALALSATAAMTSRSQILSTAPWTVTKSYIVDKGNVGGSGCNDTWPGTITQPLCTIGAGLGLVKPGEGVFLRAGTYPNFIITKSGTSSGYITVASYNGEKVVVSGGSEAILLKGVSYVRIYGFEVTGATGSWGGGIRVTQSSGSSPLYNIIENNIVHDNIGSNINGILIEDGSYNQVLNNKSYNNYLSGIRVISHPTNSPSGITGNVVTGNESYNNTISGGNSDGISLEGPGTTNTLVSYNIAHGNSDDGIDTWNSSHNTLVGNISYGQTGSGDGNGFKLGGGTTGGYNLVKQNVAYGNKLNGFDPNGTGGDVFYNNIAYNNGNFGFEDGWKDLPCTPSSCQETFINNIGYNNVRGNFSASAYTVVSHNNLWYSDSGSAKVFYNYTNYSSMATFYSASGNRLDNPSGGDQASLQANPQFINASGGTFTVQSSSPAINQGDPANPGQVIAVNRVDIGAFENGSSPTPTPLVSTQTPIVTLTPTSTLVASPTATQTSIPPTATSTASSVPASATATPTSVLPTATSTASSVPASATATPTSVLPTATLQAISQPASETIYDDKNSAFVYSSGWQDVSDQQAYNGSYKVASVKSASVMLSFTGQSFSILYTSGSSYRNIDVYVDGVLVGTIDQKTSLIQYQQRWDYPGQLTQGTHILKLVTRNRNNTYDSIDQVIVR